MNLQPYGKKDSLWWRTDGKTSAESMMNKWKRLRWFQ
nr:MAG TPA: hypothetical protein [Caudoviricetes sp.]